MCSSEQAAGHSLHPRARVPGSRCARTATPSSAARQQRPRAKSASGLKHTHLSHAALSGGTSSNCSPFHPSPGHPLVTKKLQVLPVPRPHSAGTLPPTFNKTCDSLVRSTHTKFAYDLAMDLKFPGKWEKHRKIYSRITYSYLVLIGNYAQTQAPSPKQTTHKTQRKPKRPTIWSSCPQNGSYLHFFQSSTVYLTGWSFSAWHTKKGFKKTKKKKKFQTKPLQHYHPLQI